ncbi:MAG: IMP dehydrogenase [Patescibacteria group bacterium]|nr:IMP dehydrogenase [Patescibacteria group bacterium]MDE2438570.1 IMP dehydrogenase [Patescibacteria group bacterium]
MKDPLLALSYDDVLLVPRFSSVRSRKDPCTATQLTVHIKLEIPIVSANMDTVTESRMAIALARLGGIGIIHRFMSVEREVEEVLKVKRAEAFVIDDPYTVEPETLLTEARARMQHLGAALLVVDRKHTLVGILTNRDIEFVRDGLLCVKDVMTTRLITASRKISMSGAEEMFKLHKIEKLPLVDAKGKLVGLITKKDIVTRMRNPHAAKDNKGRLLVGAAVGVVGDYVARTKALVDAGVDCIVIDIAHGHSIMMKEAIAKIKKITGHSVDIIAGNIATAEGVRDVVAWGAHAVKVGIGPGAACTTRIMTGVGVPQFSAVLQCAKMAKRLGIPVIADGGIKYSGDITKALAAGAESVMIGSMFAGTDESPGVEIVKNGARYKRYRGMASLGANVDKNELLNPQQTTDYQSITPEGVEATVPYKGSLGATVAPLMGGLRSGMSYLGAMTIKEMSQKGEYVRITQAGIRESNSHDIDVK